MTRRRDDGGGFDLAFLLWLIPGSLAPVFFSSGWTVAGIIAAALTGLGILMQLSNMWQRRRGSAHR